ncbi:hypothetical protein [Novosphingobium kaempferiae]|uniref:hypothetical protein n=1 Tax=Novosphingobium kaempferiae TaxID=2896849 RepID=UPI001E3A543C|nr:hypothetical protein [Novosphingobium kaempferiae]
MVTQSLISTIEQSFSQSVSMAARIIAEVGHRARFAQTGGAFVEEWGLFVHVTHKQLPFRRARRK